MRMKKGLKKVLGWILVLVLAVSVMPNMVSRAETARPERTSGEQTTGSSGVTYVGDVDGDGSVTPKDVTKLRRFLAGGWNVNVEVADGDVDGDGSITPKDVTKLRRYLAGGWGVELPVKNGELKALSVAQTSLDTVAVTFNSKIIDLSEEDFRFYYLVGSKGVRVEASAVAYVSRVDNIAYVTCYAQFTGGTEYYVEYNKETIGSFVATTVKEDSVKAILITSGQKFDKEFTGTLGYSFYDENGVDISKAALLWNEGANLTAEFVDKELADNSTLKCDGKKVSLDFDKEGTYTIKLTYSWIREDGVTCRVESIGSVESITVPWVRGEITGAVRKDFSQNLITAKNTINSNATSQLWAIGDNEINGVSTAYLQIAVPYYKNGRSIYEGFGVSFDTVKQNGRDINGPKEFYKYKVASANETIIMISEPVDDGDGNEYIKLIANKCGETNIVVYGVSSVDNKDVETIIGYIPIEIKAKRTPEVLKVAAKSDKINLAYPDDGIDFDIVMLDQYDEEMVGLYVGIKSIDNESQNGPQIIETAAMTGSGNGAFWYPVDWRLTPDMLIGTGELNLEFKCENKTCIADTITVGREAVKKRNELVMSATSIDTAVNRYTFAKDLVIALRGRTENGFLIQGDPIYYTDQKPSEIKKKAEDYLMVHPDANTPDDNNWLGCIYNVYKDNRLVTFDNMAEDYKNAKSNLYLNFGLEASWDYNVFHGITTLTADRKTFDAEHAYDPDSVTQGDIISKLDSGTYRVEAYELTADSNNVVKITLIGSQEFTVTDSQKHLEIIKNDNSESLATIDDASVDSAFTVMFDEELVKSIEGSTLTYNYVVDGEGKAAYIKSVTANIVTSSGILVLTDIVDCLVKVAK